MTAATPAELLAFLREHQFLTPAQSLPLGGNGRTKFPESRALARELVERDLLTPYQANQLLQGRGDDLLLGPYRILDRLGEGGMGQVFKARHVSMDRVVALKIIPKDRIGNPVALARFNREVRAVAKLSHPNIVTAFEASQVGDTHFLAMEHVDGIDLARLVQQSGPQPVRNACEYIRQAAAGLQHAHERGLVHRDIKPGNLIVARPHPDEPPVIKILDFGLARFESEADQKERLTQLGKVVGTVDYIAPEQAINARTADIRADIYSLGCSLYYLLAGKPPFEGGDAAERINARVQGDAPSVRASRPEVPPALEEVLARMMARKPADRFQTPGEVVKALEPYAGKERPAGRTTKPIISGPMSRSAEVPAAAPPPVIAPVLRRRPREPRQGNKVRLLLIAFGAAVVLLGGVVGVIALVANSGAGDSRAKPAPPHPDGAADRKPADQPPKPTQPLPKTFTNSLGMQFVLVPKGRSWLGGGGGKPGDTEVTIPRDFYLGKYLVTQEEWQSVMGNNPSFFSRSGLGKDAVQGVPDEELKRFPVDSVTWDDAQPFLAEVNKRANDDGCVYRLPTEAEWEFACRGGPLADKRDSGYDYYFDKPTNELPPGRANFDLKRTCKVGSYPPNPLGLFDMQGNVWEWCDDRVVDTRNLAHLEPADSHRVERGGCWHDGSCPVSVRISYPPSYRNNSVGLRVARVPIDAGANELTNSIGMKLVLIAAGKFLMSSPKDEEGRADDGRENPQHEVELTRPFYMGTYPVTKGQFGAFVKDAGWQTEPEKPGDKGGRGYNAATRTLEQGPKYNWKDPGFTQTDDHPVVNVTWHDATAFCTWLSKKEGKTYELPTEAEWEYACRAGTKTRFWCGDADASLKGNANIADALLKEKLPYATVAWSDGYPFTSPVGKFNPNPWGLYDMSGNVWQWCADYYGDYQGGYMKDPHGADSGNSRVCRGGSWLSDPKSCRSASRNPGDPGHGDDHYGFRVVLRIAAPR